MKMTEQQMSEANEQQAQPTVEQIQHALTEQSAQLEALNGFAGGTVIVVEGPDNVGKTTTIEHLATLLKEAGHDVLVVREPGSTPVGEQCRDILKSNELCADTEFLLMQAARSELYNNVIAEAVSVKGQVVISDRNIVSSVVYQALLGRSGLAESVANSMQYPTAHYTAWVVPTAETYNDHLEALDIEPEDALESKYAPAVVRGAYEWLWDSAVVGAEEVNEETAAITYERSSRWSHFNRRFLEIDSEATAAAIAADLELVMADSKVKSEEAKQVLSDNIAKLKDMLTVAEQSDESQD